LFLKIIITHLKCHAVEIDLARLLLGKNVVAFDTRLRTHKTDLGKGSKVVFETVYLNEGLGYDASTGVFTAPYIEIYVFDWTTLAWQGKAAYTGLSVNGSFKSWNHCNDSDAKTWLPCSKMAVVKLRRGDKVWIGVFGGPTDTLYAVIYLSIK
jgi:hypothetical protein